MPVWTCRQCHESYTDWEADELFHEAVCEHLDRPTPREIRQFREKSSLSQSEFASLTRIGIASIKRWESGEQIPSASTAQHLQLVMMPGVLAKLRSREVTRAGEGEPLFRTEIADTTRKEAERFQLRPPVVSDERAAA